MSFRAIGHRRARERSDLPARGSDLTAEPADHWNAQPDNDRDDRDGDPADENRRRHTDERAERPDRKHPEWASAHEDDRLDAHDPTAEPVRRRELQGDGERAEEQLLQDAEGDEQ